MKTYLKTISKSIKHWYLLALSGVLFIGAGIAVIASPEESYLGLATLFSLSFVISGISEAVFAISNRKNLEGWGWNLNLSILSIIMGVFLLVYPEVSINTLPFVVAFVIMFRSIYAIGLSFELKSYGIMDWGNLLGMGILGTIGSGLLISFPVFTGISLVALTGSLFIVSGGYSIYYSIKLRKINKTINDIPESVKDDIKSLHKEVKAIINNGKQTATA